MTLPVFVIHGVGTRCKTDFETNVAKFASAIGGLTAHPIFWGNEGAEDKYVKQTIPGDSHDVRGLDIEAIRPDDGAQAVAEFLAGTAETPDTASTVAPIPDAVLSAAADTIAKQGSGALDLRDERGDRDDAAASLQAAIAEPWASTRWLQHVENTELQRAIGAAIAGPVARQDFSLGFTDLDRSPEHEGLFSDIGDFARQRIEEIDRVVGATFGAGGDRLNAYMRAKLMPGITRTVGDIAVYQRHRQKLSRLVRSEIDRVDPKLGRSEENAIDVLAHSLGGVIVVDMATRKEDPLWIRQLVTFGSQAPYFHVVDPRGGALKPYRDKGTLVDLPPSISAWTNLWEPFDPLAFLAAPIFKLHVGSPPTDKKLDHLASSGLWTHTDYWKLPQVAQIIRKTLDQYRDSPGIHPGS